MNIPLVQNNEKDSINTSIIAIKKNLERINSILGLVDSGSDIDTSEFIKKSDIVDVIESGNMNPVTSNAVATSNAMPVDEVTSGNMQSVTSNAVSVAIGGSQIKRVTYEVTYDNTSMSSSNGYKSISISSEINNANLISVNVTCGQTSSSRGLQITPLAANNGKFYFNYYKPQTFAETIPLSFAFIYRV